MNRSVRVDIKASDVKSLREKTGAGMMDCKKALVATNGDFAQAERKLKELGLAAAHKRAGRATTEGRIFTRVEDGRGILLEVSCETDFVAKNEEFIALGEKLMASALEGQKDRFDDLLSESIGRIKENIALRRMRIIENQPDELLVDYIHGEGRIGVLVRFHLSDEKLKQLPRVKEVAFDLALHAAAFAPHFLRRENVDAAYLAEQEEIFLKQAEKLGKPEKVIQGIVKGKLKKHLSGICFLEQAFVKDQNNTVSATLENLGKESGGEITITDYVCYKVGED